MRACSPKHLRTARARGLPPSITTSRAARPRGPGPAGRPAGRSPAPRKRRDTAERPAALVPSLELRAERLAAVGVTAGGDTGQHPLHHRMIENVVRGEGGPGVESDLAAVVDYRLSSTTVGTTSAGSALDPRWARECGLVDMEGRLGLGSRAASQYWLPPYLIMGLLELARRPDAQKYRITHKVMASRNLGFGRVTLRRRPNIGALP
jgi:hypothetical protein